MREKTIVVILFFIVTIIAISGYSILYFLQYTNDIVVENYTVELSSNGILEETIIYEVKTDGKYKMLFRYWDDTVTYNETIGIPHLNVISVESPYISYVKDHSGYIFSPESLTNDQKSFISLKAYNNEIGCYNPDYYNKGKYGLKITYQLSTPIQYDDQYYHMNIKLARDHIPYNNVKIIINDSQNDIIKFFSHPPMDTTKTNMQYIIIGKSPGDSLIEFEILSNNISYGLKEYVDDIYDKTISANNNYNIAFMLISCLNYILLILILGFGGIIILLYYLKGREKDHVVPEYLNFIPKKRKPWLVNLVFHKSEITIDDNAFFSTLLDLHNRKIITLKNENSELVINVDKPNEKLDEYESKVLSFLKKWSTNNVFNVKEFKKKILNREYDFSEIRLISSDMNAITKKHDNTISYQFIISGRKIPFLIGIAGLILSFLMLILLVSWGNMYPNIYPVFVFSIIFSIQAIIVTTARPTLFGKWKDEFYKEKLEWDAFRKFLSDMAQLKKYELEDLAMWKDWLVYGTALGIGKKVAEAMKQLKISLPEANTIPTMYASFHAVNLAIATTSHSSGGIGHGGGSFGGGGGFGGGGAGGR